MKRTALILLAACCNFISTAFADTLWASGVTEQAGWYDFNKERDDSDSLMCWAICSANLIAWYQNTCVPAQLQQHEPRGEAVWSTYCHSFTNEGSDPDQGLRWWFSGKYEPSTPSTGEECAVIKKDSTGGYYASAGGEDLFRQLVSGLRGEQVNAQTVSQSFYNGLKRGAAFWIGVSFYRRDGQCYTHSLNVWGVDYEMTADHQPRILAIYMTDSDDTVNRLHRIPVKEDAGQLVFDCSEHPLYGRIGHITISTISCMEAAAAVAP